MRYYQGKFGRLRLTADKREIRDFPKLPWATSFILDTLYVIAGNFAPPKICIHPVRESYR